MKDAGAIQGTIFIADMANFVPPADLWNSTLQSEASTVPPKFDVVISMFSCIGYVFPLVRLESTFKCFYDCLNPGGIIMIEPWFFYQEMTEGMYLKQYDGTDMKVCRLGITNLVPGKLVEGENEQPQRISELNFSFMVAFPGSKSAETFSDNHQMFCYTQGEYESAIKKAGFVDLVFEPKTKGMLSERGIFFARKH